MMEDGFEKPLHADCKSYNAFKYLWCDPVISRKRSYKLADWPLMMIGWLLIIIAVGFIAVISPIWGDYGYVVNVLTAIAIVIIIIAEFFYMRKFVYRFGRFRVKWARAEHPDEEASSRCDKDGNFLDTEENRIYMRKSRRAFIVLFSAIITVALVYCFVWNGLSYLRVYSWRMGDIEEARQIAQKYDYVSIDAAGLGPSILARTEGGGEISDEDRVRLWYISRSLHWDYVTGIDIEDGGKYIEIKIETIFGNSKLLWFEDIRDISQVKYYFGRVDTAVQLDEHWFYFRMDDGRFF